ncbi:endosulphine family protein [Trichodelitschia bisporula]|uniref:mRNA stability protein n=1 Tax=Trichodelitschia bisporula TaxID=703511 RepID=A0A6G1HT65_9PEZI|nr:endosulphine family protein [Trichodelitschia bisporula]
MNPHQRNKVDISSLTPDEQRLFRLYGKLPTKKDLLQNKLKERKYFDSGDYALSKAGKASDIGVTQVGREHPVPENIPHSAAPHPAINGHSVTSTSPGTVPANHIAHGGSPVKEGSFLQRETSADDLTTAEDSAPVPAQQPVQPPVAEEQGSEHAKNKPVAIQK